MEREVRRYPNLDELNRDAAAFICSYAADCYRERGQFTLALAGGRSPERLYGKLSAPPCDVAMPWSHVHWFWGDERCVPHLDPASNYRMANGALLSKIAPPPWNVHRTPADLDPPEEAARSWEQQLRDFFGEDLRAEGFPVFDLILLGLGPDGHTASLFPGDTVLDETQAWVRAVAPQGDPPVARLTFTLPLINRARLVVFLVSGKGKADVVARVLAEPPGADGPFPASRVCPDGRLIWFLDGAFV